MRCPRCNQKATTFTRFVRLNLFKQFHCGYCGATLKADTLVKLLCVVSFGVALGTCFYTFPLMYKIIHSQSNSVARFLLDLLLPYIVIPTQMVVMFIPAGLYTWYWGRLEQPAI